jgi:hypothetical protein
MRQRVGNTERRGDRERERWDDKDREMGGQTERWEEL